MTIYARQIEPEFQGCYLWKDIENGYIYDDVILTGNRDYKDKTTGIYDKILEICEYAEILDIYDNLENEEYYENIVELVNDYMPIKNDNTTYSENEAEKIIENVRDYYEGNTYNEYIAICKLLEIVTGIEHDFKMIRGCVQGEWQYAIYPVTYSKNDINTLEKIVFNLGTEWEIHDDDNIPENADDICGYCLYCYGDNIEEIKQEIKDNYYKKADDVVLYTFNGYKQIASYSIA